MSYLLCIVWLIKQFLRSLLKDIPWNFREENNKVASCALLDFVPKTFILALFIVETTWNFELSYYT